MNRNELSPGNENEPMAVVANYFVNSDGSPNPKADFPLEALNYDALRTIVSKLDPSNDEAAEMLNIISDVIRTQAETGESSPIDDSD